MADDGFLSASILDSAFQTFIELCNCTEYNQQHDDFITIIQPIRDTYYGLLLKAQERISSLQSSQEKLMEIMQTMNQSFMTLEDTRRAEKEVVARTEENLREECARWHNESLSAKEQCRRAQEETARWHNESINAKEQCRRAQEETTRWHKESLSANEQCCRAQEETTRWHNESLSANEQCRRAQEETTRWHKESLSANEQCRRAQEETTRWHKESLSANEQCRRAQEETTRWHKESLSANEQCCRAQEETTRWYNEYHNALQTSEDKDSRLKIKGSESRAKVWKNIKDSPEHPVNQPLTVQNTWEYNNFAIASLVNSSRHVEADMYQEFIDLLKSALEKPIGPTSQGVKILDTHKKYYLRGLAPDITVSVDGVQDPDAASVYMVIEVKLRDDATQDGENLGQLIDYLLEIRAAQKSRRRFAGLLTSLKSNVIVVLESLENEREFVTHYMPVNLQKALDFIQETVLAHPAHQPPKRTFSLELGVMLRRLGKPTNSVVAEFYQARDGQQMGNRMAVKRSHAQSKFIWSELKVLQMIRDNAPKRISSIFPELVYTSRDEREFGIIPVGTSLFADCLPSAKETRQVLHDVLDALIWLHNLDQPLIHRDVRCQNVIIRRSKDGARGVLIDFDQVAISDIETSYRGGYLCCPRELIGQVTLYTRYIPKPRHDYEAFVLMANMLAFSGRRLGGVLWSKVTETSEASKLLSGFWSEIEKSPVWSQYLVAAQEEKPESLKDISRLFVYV